MMKAVSPLSTTKSARVIPYTLSRPLSTAAPDPPRVASLPSRDPATIVFPTAHAAREAYLNPETAKPLTRFQWKVYDLTYQIPPGRTTTYGALAAKLATSPRAVGTALSKNPFCPLVPCHRVVASDGKMGGFMGATAPSGLQVTEKVSMLRSEGVQLKQGKAVESWVVKSVHEGGKTPWEWA